MTEAIEITTFKLAGCTSAAFIKANAELDRWLQQQPGFRSRKIVMQGDGHIVDVLVWDSVKAGKSAATRLMNELADSPVHAMIDQSTVSWQVLPVLHAV